MSKSILELSGNDLTLEQLLEFEDLHPECVLAESARARMQDSVGTVERVVRGGKTCYGINTGFGAFANRRISSEQVETLQYNLVRSHCTGTGTALAPHLVRRIMLLKANSLAVGASGIRAEVVDTLLALLNRDVLPVIPEKGSVGASGDLAPLAHLALALIGEGEATQGNSQLSGHSVLEAAGRDPVKLQAKEGLALLNGTQVSAALAMEGYFQGMLLFRTAISSGALSIEALAGSHAPYDSRIHEARRMRGQQVVAATIRSLLDDSEIKLSHTDCGRVQDPYAVRCMPQVMGAICDTFEHARKILDLECNSVSDNPLIFGDEVLSGGNFHAEPLGFISDFMAIAVAEIGNITERRIDLLVRSVNPALSMFLTAEPGLESGFMIAQVTAAALASENKTLAHPASIDSIPTSAGQEDHVSMAPWAGRKLIAICENVADIVAIELLAGCVALDQMHPLRTTRRLQELHKRIRSIVPSKPEDHRLDQDIARISASIRDGQFAAVLSD